jgi:hypothetical protein
MRVFRRSARAELDKQSERIEKELAEHVLDRGRVAVIQAPPGSGKTWLLLKTIHSVRKSVKRIAIAAQTNSQADDICRRMHRDYPKVPVIRFAAGGARQISLGNSVTWATATNQLPRGACIVVATTAKWGLVSVPEPYDVLFIEEAWQLSWADFMLLGQVSDRFVMIGDPGQIPPVVTVEVQRWETAPRPPHAAAPRLLLEDPRAGYETWRLPATRRLPHDAVAFVRPFYDFEFGAYCEPGERELLFDRGGRSPADRAIDRVADGSTVAITLPTPKEGPPFECDVEIAEATVELVKRLLARKAVFRNGRTKKLLTESDIGLVATHRVMNSTIQLALPRRLQGKVMVDTPERWQGLERPVMVIVHPLSGVVRPSAFDLETGRLCVMASRHLGGMFVVGRDHISATLASTIPSAEQPIGRPDVAGRGLRDHVEFWGSLESAGQVVAG